MDELERRAEHFSNALRQGHSINWDTGEIIYNESTLKISTEELEKLLLKRRMEGSNG